MKKKFMVPFFVVAALMLVVCQVGFAQDMEGRLGIGARVAYISYSDADVKGVDIEYDESVMYGLNLTYFAHKYISLELSVDWVETDLYLEDFNDLNAGEIEQIPILFSVRTHLSTNSKVSPYLTFGIGYYINDFDEDSSISTIANIDVDDSFGWHVGAGLEYFFNDHIAFNLDLKYIMTNIDVDGDVDGTRLRDDKIDADAFTAGVGFKYYF
jgi:outer membrane protein